MTTKIKLLFLLSLPLSAQLTPPFSTTRTGATLPATCGTGNLFTKTGSGAGLYVCGPANTWTGPLGTGGGGGSNPVGGLGAVQTYASSSTLYGDQLFKYYPSGIGDPSTAPTVVATCSGTCDTEYQYVIIEDNGLGYTLISPPQSVMNTSVLDGSHFNTITMLVPEPPNQTDPNISCNVYLVDGGNIKQLTGGDPPCDGTTTVDDMGNYGYEGIPPSQNRTIGVLFNGGGATIGVGNNGLNSTFPSHNNILLSPTPNQTIITPNDGFGNPLNGQYHLFDGTSYYWASPHWFSGYGMNVTAVDSFSSPYTVLPTDGFLKCDATSGDRTAVLPDPTAKNAWGGIITRIGRVYVMHKTDASGNACTLDGNGNTIDGQATRSITDQYATTSVYWDGMEWATSDRSGPAYGVGGFTGSGTSCAITEIVNGKITAAVCTP